MKLMSLGVEADSRTPFKFPTSLKLKGLKPTHEFEG